MDSYIPQPDPLERLLTTLASVSNLCWARNKSGVRARRAEAKALEESRGTDRYIKDGI